MFLIDGRRRLDICGELNCESGVFSVSHHFFIGQKFVQISN